jgi:tetratricopeptide (TPR) repeat protein
MHIAFRYRDANLAKQVVQKLVEQVYEENRKYRGDQSLGTTDFLTQQLRAAEEKMLDAEARLGEVQEAHSPHVSRTELGANTSRIYVIDSRLRDLRHDRRIVEEKRNLKNAELSQALSEIKLIESRTQEYYQPRVETLINYWHLYNNFAAARAAAVRMRERWRPGFVDREVAELELRDAEAALMQFRNEQARMMRNVDRETAASRIVLIRNEIRALELQESSSQKEEQELRAEAARLKDQTASPAGLEVDMLTARREYEIAKEQYAVLVKKEEESKAASEMERRGQGETVELLEPPTLPTRSEFPPLWLRLVAAFAAGAFAAIAACFLHATKEARILHEGHVEQWAGLEVLAMLTPPKGRSKTDKEPKKNSFLRRRAATTIVLLLTLFATGCAEIFDGAAGLHARGQRAEKDGNPAAALLYYRKAIRKDPRYAPAYRAAAALSLRQGELRAARDLLVRAVELDSNDPDILVKLADTTYQIYFSDPGRSVTLLREVEEMAAKLEARWPRRADGYRIFAQVLLERYRTEEAVAHLRDGAAKVDHREILDAQAASALFRLGRAAESEALLREVIGRVPDYAAPYDLLYLQLMQRHKVPAARQILDLKWRQTSQTEAALQLAAHDDAFDSRDAAARVLAALESAHNGDPLALAHIGDFWMSRGAYDLARAAYERGQQRFPARAIDYISRRAEWFLTRNQLPQAKAYIAKELAARPNETILRAYAAAIEISDPRTTRRVEERRKLEVILQQLPESPFVRYHMGRAYLLEGKAQPALDQFERCVKLDPNYAPGWLALAELEIARGNPAAAEQRAESVLRTDPNHVPANLVRARALVSRGKTADAAQTLDRLLDLQPDHQDALFLYASAEMARNNRGKALDLLQKGRTLDPAGARWVLAEADLLPPAEAIKTLRAALDGSPNDESLLARIAALQIETRDAHGAVATFETLKRINPAAVPYRLGLAGALALAGQRQRASDLYAQLQREHPAEAAPFLQHAALLNEMKDTAAAIARYQEALRIEKNNPIALNNLAWLLLQTNGPAEKALEYALQARRVYGRSPEIDDTLAAAYARLSMHRNAIAVYEEMLSYVPAADKPRVQKLLQNAQQLQSQKGKA